MAAFSVIGFVESIKVLQDSCLLFLSEFKKGYKKPNGDMVDDKYISWKIIFKGYFKKYLVEHFNRGVLVEVKGEIFPYAIEHEKIVDGCSVIGQTCNVFSYPRYNVKQEQKMMNDTQAHSDSAPDIEAYNQPDF